jgi:hypothetical protein
MSDPPPTDPPSPPPKGRRDPLLYAAPALILAALLLVLLMAWLGQATAPAPVDTPTPTGPQPTSLPAPTSEPTVPPTDSAQGKPASSAPLGEAGKGRATLPDPGDSLSDILTLTLPQADAGDAHAACVAASAIGRCRSPTQNRFAHSTDQYWVETLARDPPSDEPALILRLERLRGLARRISAECAAFDPELRQRESSLLWQAGQAGHVESLRSLLRPELVSVQQLIDTPSLATELQRLQPLAFDLLLRRGDPDLPWIWQRALMTSADPPMLAGRPRAWRDPAMVRGLTALRAAQLGLTPPAPVVRVSADGVAVEQPDLPPTALAESLFQRHFRSRLTQLAESEPKPPPDLGLTDADEARWLDPASACTSLTPDQTTT